MKCPRCHKEYSVENIYTSVRCLECDYIPYLYQYLLIIKDHDILEESYERDIIYFIKGDIQYGEELIRHMKQIRFLKKLVNKTKRELISSIYMKTYDSTIVYTITVNNYQPVFMNLISNLRKFMDGNIHTINILSKQSKRIIRKYDIYYQSLIISGFSLRINIENLFNSKNRKNKYVNRMYNYVIKENLGDQREYIIIKSMKYNDVMREIALYEVFYFVIKRLIKYLKTNKIIKSYGLIEGIGYLRLTRKYKGIINIFTEIGDFIDEIK